MTDGTVKDIAADQEVILAAGAINSPKLLMLSGAGEAKALRSLGIDVVEELPGVGASGRSANGSTISPKACNALADEGEAYHH